MPDTHIKMPDIAPLVRYLADGTQTQFVFAFPVFNESDIAVYFKGARQYSGFDIIGAGETEGGMVQFDTAPASGVIVMLERKLPLARMTDFLEGGDFSARAINNELDFLIATVQQVNRAQTPMLRYSDAEVPSSVFMPPKSLRANKVLGFDGDGNPVALDSAGGDGEAFSFTASGVGAETRTGNDKCADVISIKDFGAVGDGVADDTLAIQQALSAYDSVYIPSGIYAITSPIVIGEGKTLRGSGNASIIRASSNAFHAIEITSGFTTLSNLRIEEGNAAIALFGRDLACVQNNVSDIVISGANTGILLDGYDNTNKPCYWNNFARIVIEQPGVHGVHLKKSGAGDTPNANRFHMVRVFSKGAGTTGCGFYVEYGALNNSFIDCEANVNGPTAQACFRAGANSNATMIVNFLAESSNSVSNLRLDSGSQETMIINLAAMSDGSAIYDLSGGNYQAINAGWPERFRLARGTASDFKATLLRHDTEYINTPGTTSLDLSHTIHIVDATSGAITTRLPNAANAAGAVITVKKVDDTAHIVMVTESSGNGPDGFNLQLGGRYDFVTMISNGSQWYIISSNRTAGNTRYVDTTGTYQIDMAVDTYIVSSYGGAVTAQLPPANAAKAVGRTITIKKTDPSGNAVTVTEEGGSGPDQASVALISQYKAVTVVSNGSQWYVVSKL